MSLDVAHVGAIDPGLAQRLADHCALPRHRRRGVTHLGAAIVVQRRGFDQRVDPVAVGLSTVQRFEYHHPVTAGTDGAAGVVTERTAQTVAGKNVLRAITIAIGQGRVDQHPGGQHHVTVALTQHRRRQVHGNQRTAARRLNAECRPAEVEVVSRLGGQKVLVVVQRHLKTVGQIALGSFAQHLLEIRGFAATGDQADARPVGFGCQPGMLQRLHAAHQQVPLLRVHQPRFLQTDAEIVGIEIQQAGQLTARTDQPLGSVEPLDAQAISLNHRPELGKVARPGHIHRHADDRHGLLASLGTPLTALPCTGQLPCRYG